MLWSSVRSFSSNSTVLKLIEAISQHYCTPIHIQSIFSIIRVSACIWVCCIMKHPYAHRWNATLVITQSHTHNSGFFVEGVREVSDICCEASCIRPSGVGVIDILPNKWNKRSHKTLGKTPNCSFTNKHAQECEVQPNDGTMVAEISALHLIRAGGLWLRGAARLIATRCWRSEWQGCHGDRGVSAWGRRPAAEDLPV